MISATVDFSVVEKQTAAPHTLSVAAPTVLFKGLTDDDAQTKEEAASKPTGWF